MTDLVPILQADELSYEVDGMNKMFLKVAGVLAAVLLAMSVTLAEAAKPVSIRLDDAQTQAVQRINDYFNSFKSLKGDFTQVSPRGNSVKGVMMISKPGKLRFDYAPPSPLLIASDGTWLTIKNRQKEKGDQVPIASTPLRLIVSPKLDLFKETAILAVESANGFTTLTVADKNENVNAGSMIIVFDEANNALQQWIIVDGKGQRTTVQLENLQLNVALDPKLFKVTIVGDKSLRK
jgi:outer membrane lipoprotein-sorting protein